MLARKGFHSGYRLMSKRALGYPPAALRGLALYRGEQLLVSELPSPSLRHHTVLAPHDGATAQEALYRVVDC